MLSEPSGGEVVELRVGEEHRLRLPGLGTAGYRWAAEVSGDPGVADVSAAGVEAPASGAIGASAREAFSIRANRPGEVVVRFAQRRPWEPEDEAPAEERAVHLRVI